MRIWRWSTYWLVTTLCAAVAIGAPWPLAAQEGGRPLETAMRGAAEVPGPGDPDGTGTASLRLNPGQQQVCFELQVANITLPAIGAHIHRGSVTQAGPVVVALTPPDASGTSSGCATADRDLVREIIQNPEAFYVNVHTSDFPAGAVRGQLAK